VCVRARAKSSSSIVFVRSAARIPVWHTSLEPPIRMVEIRLGPSYYTLFITFSVFFFFSHRAVLPVCVHIYLQLLNRPQARLFVRMRNYVSSNMELCLVCAVAVVVIVRSDEEGPGVCS